MIMPTKPPTLADLRKDGVISSVEIVAAIDRYVQNPTSGPYRFASGHSIDIAAAIAASPETYELRKRPGPQEKMLRGAITIIVMAAQVRLPDP